MKFAAIVLAAGRSTRMGQQKLVMPFGKESTMVSRVVNAMVDATVPDIVVVTGPDGAAVRSQLAGQPVQFAENPDVDRGMLSSIRIGLAATPDADAYIIALGDMPLITGPIVSTLMSKHNPAPNAITLPTYDDRRGHPVIIDAAHREAIHSQYDDVGLRGLMEEHPVHIQTVPLDTESILIDLDTPEDYDRHRQ